VRLDKDNLANVSDYFDSERKGAPAALLCVVFLFVFVFVFVCVCVYVRLS